MNIETNEKLVRRYARIAQVTMIGGLLVLAAGMYVSFSMPEQFGLSLTALMVGYALSQVGISFSNRWGRRPRPDQLISQALKGLDGRHTLYHFIAPASHLLVGPSGLWVFLPRHQRGTISYSKGRWRQKGGNIYMKIFAQEGIGRPDLDVSAEVENLRRFLAKQLGEENVPPIQAALVFTHPKAEVKISPEETPPAETVQISKLKEMVRKKAKDKALPMDKVEEIRNLINAKLEPQNKQNEASDHSK